MKNEEYGGSQVQSGIYMVKIGVSKKIRHFMKIQKREKARLFGHAFQLTNFIRDITKIIL